MLTRGNSVPQRLLVLTFHCGWVLPGGCTLTTTLPLSMTTGFGQNEARKWGSTSDFYTSGICSINKRLLTSCAAGATLTHRLVRCRKSGTTKATCCGGVCFRASVLSILHYFFRWCVPGLWDNQESSRHELTAFVQM